MAKAFIYTCPTRVEDRGDFATLTCSNEHNCRETLNVSHNDTAELLALNNLGRWRFVSWPGKGGIHAFCPRCTEDLIKMGRLPLETSTLYRGLR